MAVRLQEARDGFHAALRKVIKEVGVEHAVRLFQRGSFACRISAVVDDFCCLANHLHCNGMHTDLLLSLLGTSKLNGVITQLTRQLVQLHGEELALKLTAFSGPHAHKNHMAEEIMKQMITDERSSQ